MPENCERQSLSCVWKKRERCVRVQRFKYTLYEAYESYFNYFIKEKKHFLDIEINVPLKIFYKIWFVKIFKFKNIIILLPVINIWLFAKYYEPAFVYDAQYSVSEISTNFVFSRNFYNLNEWCTH